MKREPVFSASLQRDRWLILGRAGPPMRPRVSVHSGTARYARPRSASRIPGRPSNGWRSGRATGHSRSPPERDCQDAAVRPLPHGRLSPLRALTKQRASIDHAKGLRRLRGASFLERGTPPSLDQRSSRRHVPRDNAAASGLWPAGYRRASTSLLPGPDGPLSLRPNLQSASRGWESASRGWAPRLCGKPTPAAGGECLYPGSP